MLKIGIVGAENSHCANIARVCNVEKKVPHRVVAVWGERPRFARAAAEAAKIPTIVKDWREMLGMVDGIMIDHRHAAPHFEVAEFFVRNKVPCFVDKPFTFTLAEGKALCELAKRKRVPITTFSTIPLQKNFKAFQKACGKIGKLLCVNTSGPVDLKSKYGGIFFYGIHQVDAIIELMGADADRVHVLTHGKNGVATILFKNGAIATMNCLKAGKGFNYAAYGDAGEVHWTLDRDPAPYLGGLKLFAKMFQTGKEPIPHRRMLAPVAVLEAMARSLKRKTPVKVAGL